GFGPRRAAAAGAGETSGAAHGGWHVDRRRDRTRGARAHASRAQGARARRELRAHRGRSAAAPRSGVMTLERRVHEPPSSATLVDLLDRVLDKGLVVAGDVSISLANVELLTIRVRLLVCSIDKAEQIGLNWWRHDPSFGASDGEDQTAIGRLEKRIAELERELERSRKPGR